MPPLIIYSVATFYYYFPNLLSYTNEFIATKKYAYKTFADSNLDFGQGWFTIEQYLKNHPDTKLAGTEPAAGKFVLGINDYLDLNQTGEYSWLSKFNPDAHVDHCFLLFKIRTEDLHK